MRVPLGPLSLYIEWGDWPRERRCYWFWTPRGWMNDPLALLNVRLWRFRAILTGWNWHIRDLRRANRSRP